MRRSLLTLVALLTRACGSFGGEGETVSVGCINCGAFHYGEKSVQPAAYEAEWTRLRADWPQDVFFYEDVGKKGKGTFFVNGLDVRADSRESPQSCEIVELPCEIDVGGEMAKTPRNRALRLVYRRSDGLLAIYGVHLVAEGHIRGPKPKKGEPSWSQKLRQLQFQALIADAEKYRHAILTGDFNAQKSWEYEAFSRAGFVLGNGSDRYGTVATLRNIPADNIILSPGLSFDAFEVLKNYRLNTDHCPLVATIRFSSASQPEPLPSVAVFLELPRERRRDLFANPDFRQKMYKTNYPDGEGLLSRWVRIEKIPNLRDVGGIVNSRGQTLRRGIYYRSAGWNDNAVCPKDKPQAEWKRGESRLTERGRADVRRLGIRTDLDLRSDIECWGMTASPLGEDVRWKHVSFGHYDEIVRHERFKEAVKEVFGVLSDPSSRPLVFHCIGGADRTGSLAFLVQAICDVDEDTLVKDWELTGCYTARSSLCHEKCIDRLLSALSACPGSNVREKVESFLKSCGVTAEEIRSVRAALLEERCPEPGYSNPVSATCGISVPEIVVPENANCVEQYAAEELRYHIGKAVGREPEIVPEGALELRSARCRFYVGATEAAKKARLPVGELADEERLLKAVGGDLFLLGGDSPMKKKDVTESWSPSARGTLYAVYDFLENEMGVRWLWPGPTGEYVPKTDAITFGVIDRRGIEPYEMRLWSGVGGANEKQIYGWTDVAARKCFHEEQAKFLTRHRVGRRTTFGAGHAFGEFVGRFLKTHPEYFQLKPDGTRGPWHPGNDGWNCSMCVSNPGLPKIVVSDWYEKYAKVAGQGRFPVCPVVNACENDTPGACRCARCRAWDGPDPRFKLNDYWNGSRDSDPEMSSSLGIYGRLADMNRWGESANKPPTEYSATVGDRYAKFYNAVLAEARKKVPEARVVAYAYQNYLEGPIETQVNPGVIIEFVPRMYLPYDKAESDFLRRCWENWRKAGVKDLVFRPNFTHALGGFPVDQARQYCDDIAWCADRGLCGISLDALMGSFSAEAMHDYAITRSFRDPKRGYEKARADMVSAFGTARTEIDRYFDFIENHSKEWTHESFEKIRQANPIHHGIFGGGFNRQANILGDFYSDGFFTEAYRLLDDAMKAAVDDVEVCSRIEFLRKGIVNTELTRKTRLARKAVDADKGNAAKQAIFVAAFRAMNDYRTSIQFDCALNLHREAFWEFKQLQWPHQPIDLKK